MTDLCCVSQLSVQVRMYTKLALTLKPKHFASISAYPGSNKPKQTGVEVCWAKHKAVKMLSLSCGFDIVHVVVGMTVPLSAAGFQWCEWPQYLALLKVRCGSWQVGLRVLP